MHSKDQRKKFTASSAWNLIKLKKLSIKKITYEYFQITKTIIDSKER